MKIGCLMLCARNEPFIAEALESTVGVVDEVVVIGDPAFETRAAIDNSPAKAKLYWRSWDGSYGRARNYALDILRQRECTHVLSLDADEVLSDDAFLLRELAAKNNGETCWDLEYVHFIRNLGLIDATQERHRGLRRFYPLKWCKGYSQDVHEVAEGDWPCYGFPDNPKIYHLGYLKGLNVVEDKYRMNLEKSKSHSKEFLKQWHDWHVKGTYPVKAYDGPYPTPVRTRFEV